MRTKEQFRAYVYKKADEKKTYLRKSRAAWIRGTAAFSLLVVIGGVMLYGRGIDQKAFDNNMAPRNSAENEMLTIEMYGLDVANIDDTYEETAACGKTETYSSTTSKKATGTTTFNYSIDLTTDYSEAAADVIAESGKYKNTEKCPIISEEDAIALAKNECTVEYNQISVAYDVEADIWKVVFFKENTVGGCETVYLNGDGTTKLIVYGE